MSVRSRALTVQQLINHRQASLSKFGTETTVARSDGCGLSRARIVSDGIGMKKRGLAVTGA